MLLLKCILFMFCLNIVNAVYNYRVIKTPIFKFTIYVKQHHVVFIQYKDKHPFYRGTYAVDFTPIKQTWKTLIRLALGMSIPSKIRIHFIVENVSFDETDEILEQKWLNSKLLMNPVQLFPPIVKLQEESKWKDPQYMNLYSHNCQHFSHDLITSITIFINKNYL